MVKPLMAAVRGGDAQAVDALPAAGADPDTEDEGGTPALRLAVEAFDHPIVEALLQASAGTERADSAGRTPLLRAIELGARDIVESLITHGARLWVTDAEGRDALELARYWYGRDLVAELHRATGLQGPVVRRTVPTDSEAWISEELSLGGLAFRTGHAAILTGLEWRHGIVTSFDELLSRALAEPDVDHEVWWETTAALHQHHAHHHRTVWDAAAALRHRPDPLERRFGAEVMRVINLFDESDDVPFDGPLVDLFLPWLTDEPDARVTWSLTAGLCDAVDPRAEEPLAALTRHSDSRVRQFALGGLRGPIERGHPEALAAAVERTGDEDATVRRTACHVLVVAPPHDRAVSDSLAACLGDPDPHVRVEAAARPALRDDPRGDEILRELDPADENSPYRRLLYDVYRHRRRC
ncbi:HEAT repeat domain-containing protein [Streptomyces virginiae]|uniref:HEAT repeat domain-containing protein n=1 Tax=Streptomyces virginiae TaxID=1961 RepID=UPI00364B9C14